MLKRRGTYLLLLGGLVALASAALLWDSLAAAYKRRPAAKSSKDGTREMAVLLEDRAAKVDPRRLQFYVNDRRAAMLAEELKSIPLSLERFQVQMTLALELLNAGRIDESLETLAAVEADVKQYAPMQWEMGGAENARFLRAMAYLRMAEVQNCCSRNNKDSCLMPIKGDGIHTRKEGSTKAIATLQDMLRRKPDDLRARWLLNIAYMTLGLYPDGVPKRFVMPPGLFASDYPLRRFTNVARETGVALQGLAGGAIMDDFDKDGRFDLVVSHMGFDDQMRFFWNKGDGTFEDRTEKSGLVGETGGLNMVHADYDNDGYVDVVVLRGGWMGSEGMFPLSLLRNNGNGTFSDVTVDAGLLRFGPTQNAAWLDYDGDGWIDLFVGNETSPGSPTLPCHLFRNDRGKFTDVAKEVGVDFVGFVKGSTSADYDNDGRPDLYLSVQGRGNVMFHNDGPGPQKGSWRFSDATARAGVSEPRDSFGTFFFDYDNDGWSDLFVVGYSMVMADDVAADYLGLPTEAHRGRLYHNEKDGTFKDVTKEMGLYKVIPSMGHNFGDLDNDGWTDIYFGMGNPHLSSLFGSRMFRNHQGRLFQDVTAAGNFGHLQKGHGIAFGDLDNDGDEDIFAQMGGALTSDVAYSALYENPGNENHWIELKLEGVRSNRSAIGARIEVAVETPSGPRTIHRTVVEGGSFGGSPYAQHIGLGKADRVASVKILWPATGETQTLAGLAMDGWYRIQEGAGEAESVPRTRFALGRPQGSVRLAAY